jgi:hypothetical protein
MRRVWLGNQAQRYVAASRHTFSTEQLVAVYWETLPAHCPPGAAFLLAEPMTVMRLIKGKEAANDDFAPHATRPDIKLPPNHDPCVACSCSLFTFDPNKDAASQYKKLPKLKRRFIAFLRIDAASGKCVVSDRTGHVSLWMFAAFDPLGAVLEVRERS